MLAALRIVRCLSTSRRLPTPVSTSRRLIADVRCLSTSRRLIADVQVLPTPVGSEGYEHIEAAIAALASQATKSKRGLDLSVHPLGTSIEGPENEVWAAARSAFDACLESGATSEMMILKLCYLGNNKSAAELRASGQACADAAERPPTESAASAAQQQAARPTDFQGVDVSAFARLGAHREEVRGGGGGGDEAAADPPGAGHEPSGRPSTSGGSTVDVTAYSRLRPKR